jgi:hypothetical protein
VHVFACHWRDVHHKPLVRPDGRPMPLWIPNSFLDRFCDVVERRGMAGKFSIVPAPGGLGDVVNGIADHDPALTRQWLETMQRRLSPRWSFCSEGITHNLAADLTNGGYFPEGENAWSQHQDRSTLTPYLIHQLELLREAGVDATGVTSPWVFGIEVEDEYIAALVAAQRAVYGREFSWYFLHMLKEPDTRPWVAYRKGQTTLVHLPANTDDVWWATIDSVRDDAEFLNGLADKLLTEDGRSGAIREILDAGGWPILLTHWQSLFSNGLETGLAALDEVGRRIESTLGDEVEWQSFDTIARRTAAEWGDRPATGALKGEASG